MSTRLTLRAGVLSAMGLCLLAYLAGLALQGDASNPIVDVWLSLLTSWLPAAVCWVTLWRVGFRRWEVLLAAVAITSVAAGDTYYAPLTSDWSPQFPSLGDLGYVLFYLLGLAALVAVVRRDARGRAWSVWLDCAVGSLGAASVLAVVLSPVLASALTGPPSLSTVVAIAYPMFDLLFIATVCGMVAVRGLRGGRRVAPLIAGLMLYAAADVVYALQVTSDTYVVSSALDAAWTIGVTLVALYVDHTVRLDGSAAQDARPATGSTALVVSGLATAAGLGVLLVSSQTPVSRLAVTLAAVTLVAAAARTQVAFRQLLRMADLQRQATTDDLTGLPNRRALYLEASARLLDPEHRRRQALLMLDLDRFKEVNDSLGHLAGDQLLIQVGARLSKHLRSGDLLVRLGGDEFALLLEGAGHDQAAAVAAKLCTALAEPFDLEDIPVHSGASIGIALFPDHGTDLSTLLRKADVAMYKAKAFRDRHHIYGGTDDTDFATRLRMVEELRTALTSGQLVVHYQPKIDLRTSAVRGVEALVRWDHPTRGLLYPDGFLEVVEEAGLMRSMTRAVLEIALDQAARWHACGRPLSIAVNLSASSLVDAELPDEIAAMLDDRALPPGSLQLEITEESLMGDRDRARDILTRLRGQGVQISVDDFGTGYSSLAYLRDLPIDELKLDRSFVMPMVDDARAAALVASTVALAHSLDLRMVAEGVENETAYTDLARLGCDQGQGYFICRPVPATELDNWLTARRVSARLAAAATSSASAVS